MTLNEQLQAGDRFAGHRIEGPARAGGTGRVYRATQLELDRTVALELLHGDAEPLAAFDHPNVVPVYEMGEAEGRPYLTMRWVEGSDLAALLSTASGLERGHVLAIAGQTAAALDAAHVRGLAHGDVKPANVLLEGDHAYLSGFGGGRGRAVDYVAPELIEGAAPDAPADVYALGCVIWECLTGRPPYLRGDDAETLRAHREAAPPSLLDLRPDLPAALDAVLARALAKDPERRWASAGELVRAARGVADRT